MAREPTPIPPGITKPDPPPAPPPKTGSVPRPAPLPPVGPPPKRTLDRDAKLDAILELLEALAAHALDMGTWPSDLERLLAKRRGQCSHCLGQGWLPTMADIADPHRARHDSRCEHCSGTGKAETEESQP